MCTKKEHLWVGSLDLVKTTQHNIYSGSTFNEKTLSVCALCIGMEFDQTDNL